MALGKPSIRTRKKAKFGLVQVDHPIRHLVTPSVWEYRSLFKGSSSEKKCAIYCFYFKFPFLVIVLTTRRRLIEF